MDPVPMFLTGRGSGAGGTGVPGCARECEEKRAVLDVTQAEAAAASEAAATARSQALVDTQALDQDINAAIDDDATAMSGSPIARQQAVVNALVVYPVFWLRWIALTGFLLLGDLVPVLRTGRPRSQSHTTKAPMADAAVSKDANRTNTARPAIPGGSHDPDRTQHQVALPAAAVGNGSDVAVTPLNRADVSAPAPPTEPFSAHASPNTVVTEEMPSAQDRARGPESAGPNTRTGTPAASATAADGLRSATTTDVLGPVEADEPRSAGRVSGSCAPTESFATPIPDTPSSSAITAAVPMDPTSGFVDEVEIASTLAWLNAVSGVEGSYLLGLTANATGRSAAADVVIASDTASRHHCTITNDEQQVVVTAEPTPNGTYVNHVQIAPHRPVALHTGNILGLGRGIHLQVFIPEVERDITHLKFRSAGWSDIGGRSHNEDAFHDGDHVIAVADGVGGRPAGEQAAWLAVQGVRGARGTVDLSRAVHAINTQIRDHGDAEPRTSGLASTLDAAVLSAQSGTPWVHGVHVGDGIALLQRPRRAEIVWLTRAHTLAAEMRTASPGPLALAPEAHPQAGQLMRAVGFAEEVQPDEWQEQAEEGQRYLLASDGLISALGEPGLRQALSELRAADPTACARTLIARAIDAGADDNVTVVIADVVPDTDVEAPTKRSVPPRRELRRGQP